MKAAEISMINFYDILFHRITNVLKRDILSIMLTRESTCKSCKSKTQSSSILKKIRIKNSNLDLSKLLKIRTQIKDCDTCASKTQWICENSIKK